MVGAIEGRGGASELRAFSSLNNEEKDNKKVSEKRNNPLSASDDAQQMAAAAAAIHLGVGTTDSVIKPALTNLVMQNSSTYDRAARLDTDFTAQRNLGTLA
jgi:hypothetical protein